MRLIFGAKIRCYCSFFQKDLVEFLRISRYDLSLRATCCLQPWQHSVYQLCRCVWDHLRTLLLVVIVAKVSNYSIKKIKIFHKQGLHPAEILKREGLPVSFSSTTSIGKTSKAVYGSEQCVCGNSA